MARPKSFEIELRDNQIRADAARGMSKVALAAKYNRSITRICQILAAESETPDVEQRAWLWANYQGGIDRLQEIIDSPGRPVTSGKGDHVIDAGTGLPAYDLSVVTDAIRTKFQGLKYMAQLVGNEKAVAKPLETTKPLEEQVEIVRQAFRENEALKAQIKQNETLQRQLREAQEKLEAAEAAKLPYAEVVED